MCRWVAYLGARRTSEAFLYEGDCSLSRQAQQSRKAKLGVHGDGGGLAWWRADGLPGRYRTAGPAWSDPNLEELTRHIESSMFLAHVRSSTGAPVATLNSHPFRIGRLQFMHNGQIGGYRQVRREISSWLDDASWDRLGGGSDSELAFALIVSMGFERAPEAAARAAFARIAALRSARAISEPIRATFALGDGERLWVGRWSTDDHPPSLYEREAEGGWLIASEPISDEQWRAVAPNRLIAYRLRDGGRIERREEAFFEA